MNNERFAVPELLFHPSDIGKESKTKHATNTYLQLICQRWTSIGLNAPLPSISEFVGVLSNGNGTLLACRNPRNGNPRGN